MSIPYGSTGCNHEMVERVTFGEKDSVMMCLKCLKEEKKVNMTINMAGMVWDEDLAAHTIGEAMEGMVMDLSPKPKPKRLPEPSGYKPLRGREPLPSEME